MKALKNPETMEKLQYGVQCLSSNELMSILTDIPTEVFTESSENLLGTSEGKMVCESMALAEYGELPKKKITPLQKTKLKALTELFRRANSKISQQYTRIHGPEDVAHYLLPLFGQASKEHFVVIFLNTKNDVIGHEIISIGSLSASVVHPREVFEAACKRHAASFIVAHNHPSGDPSPSREDIAVTDRLVKAGKIMGIHVLDHVIIGSDGAGRWVSLKEKGEIR